MSGLITLSLAVKALRRNAMRTALTALVMIIGVAAVIVMVAIGNGAQASIESQIRSAGTNIVTVSAGSSSFGLVRTGAGSTTTLTADDADAIAREVPGVQYVSPGASTRQQVVAGSSNWNTQTEGASADLPAMRAWPLEHGGFFTAEDVARAAKVDETIEPFVRRVGWMYLDAKRSAGSESSTAGVPAAGRVHPGRPSVSRPRRTTRRCRTAGAASRTERSPASPPVRSGGKRAGPARHDGTDRTGHEGRARVGAPLPLPAWVEHMRVDAVVPSHRERGGAPVVSTRLQRPWTSPSDCHRPA